MRIKLTDSFADAFIAATAMGKGAVLLHKDPEFEPLLAHIALEALLNKTRSINQELA